jgi:porphobilinogen deaminase
LAERAVLRGLQGGCQIPLGVHSTISADGLELSVHCQVLSLDGKLSVTGDIGGPAGDAEAMGTALAKQLEADGADAILKPGTRPITYSTVLLDADEQAPAPAAAPAAATAEQA